MLERLRLRNVSRGTQQVVVLAQSPRRLSIYHVGKISTTIASVESALIAASIDSCLFCRPSAKFLELWFLAAKCCDLLSELKHVVESSSLYILQYELNHSYNAGYLEEY